MTGPFLTTAIWRCRKNSSQWQSSFQCSYWLKFLRQRHVAVERQGPGPWERNPQVQGGSPHNSPVMRNALHVLIPSCILWLAYVTEDLMILNKIRACCFRERQTLAYLPVIFIAKTTYMQNLLGEINWYKEIAYLPKRNGNRHVWERVEILVIYSAQNRNRHIGKKYFVKRAIKLMFDFMICSIIISWIDVNCISIYVCQ